MRYASKGALVAAIVVFCMGGLTTAGAFAATKKGEIVNGAKVAPTKNGFTGTGKTTLKFETASGSKWTCEEAKVSGTITSKIAGSATFLLRGCKEGGGTKLNTPGKAAGEIELSVGLAGGELATESSEAGKGTRDYLIANVKEVEVQAGKEPYSVLKGALLMPVPSQETLQMAYTFALKGSKGVQGPALTTNQRSLYTPLEATFGKNPPEGISLELSGLTLTFEEPVEFI